MAPKSKIEQLDAVDDADRVLHSIFCNVANGLTQLYSQSLNHHKTGFEAGQRQALEKLQEWMEMRQHNGFAVDMAAIVSYLQNELYGGEGPVQPPSSQPQQSTSSLQLPLMASHRNLPEVSCTMSEIHGRQNEVHLLPPLGLPCTQMPERDANASSDYSFDSEMETNLDE
ncbi:hypothetical protein RJ641_034013 [Dillenia turbinata]|uniref:Uncharacterized protein n=1 Tax=Dillenia turbinata TaxID=194707 RepID=A0AAN8VKY2_9MAGN